MLHPLRSFTGFALLLLVGLLLYHQWDQVPLRGQLGGGENLLINGSFEASQDSGTDGVPPGTDIGGWTVLPNPRKDIDIVSGQPPYWDAADGSASIDLNGKGPGGITQQVTLTQGNMYQLSFALSGNPDGTPTTKTVVVSVEGGEGEGSTSFTFTAPTGHGHHSMHWENHSLQFRALQSSVTVTFLSSTEENSLFGPLLDAVSLTLVEIAGGTTGSTGTSGTTGACPPNACDAWGGNAFCQALQGLACQSLTEPTLGGACFFCAEESAPASSSSSGLMISSAPLPMSECSDFQDNDGDGAVDRDDNGCYQCAACAALGEKDPETNPYLPSNAELNPCEEEEDSGNLRGQVARANPCQIFCCNPSDGPQNRCSRGGLRGCPAGKLVIVSPPGLNGEQGQNFCLEQCPVAYCCDSTVRPEGGRCFRPDARTGTCPTGVRGYLFAKDAPKDANGIPDFAKACRTQCPATYCCLQDAKDPQQRCGAPQWHPRLGPRCEKGQAMQIAPDRDGNIPANACKRQCPVTRAKVCCDPQSRADDRCLLSTKCEKPHSEMTVDVLEGENALDACRRECGVRSWCTITGITWLGQHINEDTRCTTTPPDPSCCAVSAKKDCRCEDGVFRNSCCCKCGGPVNDNPESANYWVNCVALHCPSVPTKGSGYATPELCAATRCNPQPWTFGGGRPGSRVVDSPGRERGLFESFRENVAQVTNLLRTLWQKLFGGN